MKLFKQWRRNLFRLPHSPFYKGALAFAVFLSVGGVFYAAYVSKHIEDAGRGGALGVAEAFIILFLGENYGARVYHSLVTEQHQLIEKLRNAASKEPVTPLATEDLTMLLIAIIGRINLEAKEQSDQNCALFWASVLSTIAWGFGDCFYKLLTH